MSEPTSAQLAEESDQFYAYALCCKYLEINGWHRETPGSGWWWNEAANRGQRIRLGEAIRMQLQRDGIDTRVEPCRPLPLSEVVHLQRVSARLPARYRLICGTNMRDCGDAWVLDRFGDDEIEAVNCPRCLAIINRERRAT